MDDSPHFSPAKLSRYTVYNGINILLDNLYMYICMIKTSEV